MMKKYDTVTITLTSTYYNQFTQVILHGDVRF